VRILVLNQYFHPDQSATSQLLTELCEDLSALHEVTVVTGRPSYSPTAASGSRGLISRERLGGIRVLRVWSTSFDRSRGMPWRLTNYASYVATSVLGAAAAARPDVVVALTDPPLIGLIGAGAARIRRVPFVLVTNDIFPDVAIQLGALRSPALIQSLRLVSRTLFHDAAKVVAIGRDMYGRLQEQSLAPDRIVTIHDWSDGRVVVPLEGPSMSRQERGWEERFVVMHSGNVGLSQSLDTLIGAAELLREREDLLFAIVGEGASKERLVQHVREAGLANVEFLPYQPKESLADSLGAADLHVIGLRRGLAGYIVPSKLYGIMAAGKPYVAAVEPDSEPALVAEEHGCGIVVEPNHSVALADAILRAREMPLEEMGRRGREAFERLYDRPIATAAYARLLEEVVAESHARKR
jgi:colanic acid biosynthesis glycosyl transferase WcaI